MRLRFVSLTAMNKFLMFSQNSISIESRPAARGARQGLAMALYGVAAGVSITKSITRASREHDFSRKSFRIR